MGTTYYDVSTAGRTATGGAEGLQRLKRGLFAALNTIREDPSLKVTEDGRVVAKSLAELRRLYPELTPRDLGTIRREAVAAAAAYTADRQTPKQFTAAVTALDEAISAALSPARDGEATVTAA